MKATRLGAHRWQIAAVLVALATVVAGKQYYRHASAGELGWMLSPTAHMVGAVSGGDFVYEAGAGWIDRDLRFVIAPACAGLHFALAAFLALVLGGLPAMRTLRATAGRLVTAVAFAYVATLVVNTTRIAIAIAMHRGTIDVGGFDHGEVHRIEGVAVYLGGLCALYALARAVHTRNGPMRLLVERGRRLRWMAVPIAAYLVVTLVLPAVHGAALQGEFLRHAGWVVAVCVGVVVLAAVGGVVATLAGAGMRRLANHREPRCVVSAGGPS